MQFANRLNDIQDVNSLKIEAKGQELMAKRLFQVRVMTVDNGSKEKKKSTQN